MKLIKKNLVSISSGLIAHGVNCQGKMGSGVALAIRNKWPQTYRFYLEALDHYKKVKIDPLGKSYIVSLGKGGNPRDLSVAHCFTQRFYGRDGKRYADPEAVRTSLDSCFQYCKEWSLDLYLPQIGCGLGGLSWEEDVKPIIEELEKKYQIEAIICEL